MPGLVPGIHALLLKSQKDVDGRDKPGHDVQVEAPKFRLEPDQEMLFTAEHEDARRALQKFIAAEINPFVDEWEKADIFPAHELFKKLGDLGFLGLNKPVEVGGQGLDYSYALMMAEELGAIRCGGAPMKSKGVDIARKLDKMGMRSSETPQVFFSDVRGPKRNQIGGEGQAFTLQEVQC